MVFGEGWWAGWGSSGWGVILPLGWSKTAPETQQAMVDRFEQGACLAGYGDVLVQDWFGDGRFFGRIDDDHPVPILDVSALANDAHPVAARAGFLAGVLDGEASTGGLNTSVTAKVYDENYRFHHNWYGDTPQDNGDAISDIVNAQIDATNAAVTLVRFDKDEGWDIDGDGVLETSDRFGFDETTADRETDEYVNGSLDQLRAWSCALPILRWDRAPGSFQTAGSTWDGSLTPPSVCSS
jgi:hypothetical protein